MLGLLGLGKQNKQAAAKLASRVPDKLNADALANEAEVLLGVSGVPKSADSLAYESSQQLLAVGTSDGRVKLIGQLGVEKTLFSASKRPFGTRQLLFVKNRGLLLRVSEGGFVECWSLAHGRLGISVRTLPPVKVEGDGVTCAAPMSRDPFLVLGCSSGAVHFVSMVAADYSSTSGAGSTCGGSADALEVKALKLLPHYVSAEQLQSAGEVLDVAPHSCGLIHQLLIIHKISGAMVWDIRSASLVGRLDPRERFSGVSVDSHGQLMCGCWLQQGDFATGHQSGEILIWKIASLGSSIYPCTPSLQKTMRVVHGPAEPIVSLRFVNASRQWLLALGGQAEDEPEGLTLLSYEAGEAQDPTQAIHDNNGDLCDDQPHSSIKLPWLGKMQGSAIASGDTHGMEDPTSILGLLDVGQLLTYDLPADSVVAPLPQRVDLTDLEGTDLAPAESNSSEVPPPRRRVDATTFGIPFQDPNLVITSTEAFVIPNTPSEVKGSVSAELLRDMCAGVSMSSPSDVACMSLLGAGLPPSIPSEAAAATLYLTGHNDGSVRVWDTYSEQPQLITSAPLTTASDLPGKPPLGVSAIYLCWEQGLLVTGHSKGEVRLYQFNSSPCQLEVMTFDEVGSQPCTTDRLHEAPGFQLKLRCYVNSSEVLCLAYCPFSHVIIAGDKAGGVLCLDAAVPAVRWYKEQSTSPIASVKLACCRLPTKKERNPDLDVDPELIDGTPIPSVFFATSDSGPGVISIKCGNFIGKGGIAKPKNPGQTLCMELLDDEGLPLGVGRSQYRQVHLASGSTSSTFHEADAGAGGVGSREGSDVEGTSGQQPAMAAGVMLLTDTYLRAYQSKDVVAGSRSTELKVENPVPIIYARPFHVNGTPGIVALVQLDIGCAVQVISLPSLDVVHQLSISSCVSWFWGPPEGSLNRVSKMVALSELGQLFLLGDGKELIHCTVAAGLPDLQQPHSFYDWEVAAASHAASLALEMSMLEDPGSPHKEEGLSRGASMGLPEVGALSVDGRDSRDLSTGVGVEASLTEGRQETKGGMSFGFIEKGLGGALSKVQQGLGGALVKGMTGGVTKVAECTIGVLKTVVHDSKDVPKPHAEDPVLVYERANPGLSSLLSGLAPAPTTGALSQGRSSSLASSSYVRVSPTTPLGQGSTPASDRAALFGPAPITSGGREMGTSAYSAGIGGSEGAAKPAFAGAGTSGAPVHLRTASEIKRHYGKGGTSGRASDDAKSNDVRGVMEDNKRMLAERGEKLRQLDEKAGELEEGASNFAAMAKQLRDQQEKRAGKWW